MRDFFFLYFLILIASLCQSRCPHELVDLVLKLAIEGSQSFEQSLDVEKPINDRVVLHRLSFKLKRHKDSQELAILQKKIILHL